MKIEKMDFEYVEEGMNNLVICSGGAHVTFIPLPKIRDSQDYYCRLKFPEIMSINGREMAFSKNSDDVIKGNVFLALNRIKDWINHVETELKKESDDE